MTEMGKRTAEELELYGDKSRKLQIRVSERQLEILRRMKPRDLRVFVIAAILDNESQAA